MAIDLARACAALSVFVYHYGVGYVVAKLTGIHFFEYLAWPGATLAVPLFFALSGFCIHGAEWRRLNNRPFSLRSYTARRFWRIYPIYLVALLFSIAVDFLQKTPDSLADFIIHAGMLHGFSVASFNSINLVLWTISVECCFYTVYPLWLKLRINKGLLFAIAAGFGLTAISWLLTAAFFFPYSLPARWFFLNTWAGWLAGAGLAELLDRHELWFRRSGWWFVGAFAWLGGIGAHATGALSGRWQLLDVPMLIGLSLWPLSGLLLLEGRFRRARGVLRRLLTLVSSVGLASYSLYLLHVPLIDVRNWALDGLSSGPWRITIQALWFFVILSVCWVSFKKIELRFASHPSISHAPLQPTCE